MPAFLREAMGDGSETDFGPLLNDKHETPLEIQQAP